VAPHRIPVAIEGLGWDPPTNIIILVLTVKGAPPKVSPLICRKVDWKPATGWAPPVISGGIEPLEVGL